MSCVNNTWTEVVTPKLNFATYEPIDLSDLIEVEQLKTVENLSESIEKYQGRIVAGLVDLGWERAASYTKTLFIKSHSRLMVTFAKIALIRGIRLPYTSNAIERLMGEISKRCKHKWMHWSTEGLENMLWILLTRYTDPAFYHERFWNDYIHPSRYGMMDTT